MGLLSKVIQGIVNDEVNEMNRRKEAEKKI